MRGLVKFKLNLSTARRRFVALFGAILHISSKRKPKEQKQEDGNPPETAQ